MLVGLALMLAAPDIFLRTQVQGWTIFQSGLSCRAEKKTDWYKKVAILKAKDESASLFLSATEYGTSYFGDFKIDQPEQKFDIYFTKGFHWEDGWLGHRVQAMPAEGHVEVMTTVPFAELAAKSNGAGSIVFTRGDIKSTSFLIEGLPNALAMLDKCSKTLR
jgi:hypothetical protein